MVNFYEAMQSAYNGNRVRTQNMRNGTYIHMHDGILSMNVNGGNEPFRVGSHSFEGEWEHVFDTGRYTLSITYEVNVGEDDINDVFGNVNINDIMKSNKEDFMDFISSVIEDVTEGKQPEIVISDNRERESINLNLY